MLLWIKCYDLSEEASDLLFILLSTASFLSFLSLVLYLLWVFSSSSLQVFFSLDPDTTQFIIELNSDLQFKCIKGILKDFSNITTIWFTEFLNYCSIMIDLFSITFFTLHQKLLTYHQQIIELSSVYEWQETVLSLTIKYHTEIIVINYTDVKAWIILHIWINCFCTSI